MSRVVTKLIVIYGNFISHFLIFKLVLKQLRADVSGILDLRIRSANLLLKPDTVLYFWRHVGLWH